MFSCLFSCSLLFLRDSLPQLTFSLSLHFPFILFLFPCPHVLANLLCMFFFASMFLSPPPPPPSASPPSWSPSYFALSVCASFLAFLSLALFPFSLHSCLLPFSPYQGISFPTFPSLFLPFFPSQPPLSLSPFLPFPLSFLPLPSSLPLSVSSLSLFSFLSHSFSSHSPSPCLSSHFNPP